MIKKKKKTDVNCSIIFGGRGLEVAKDWLSVHQNGDTYKKLLAYYQIFYFLFQEKRSTFLSIPLRLCVNTWLNFRKRNICLEFNSPLANLSHVWM